jgi:DNA-binding transcriptional MerR regulator/methylmalonyl-CoA mutase cobalamin-binding subunit
MTRNDPAAELTRRCKLMKVKKHMIDESAYSIGYLSRACGIPSETIRTWERRYGYPIPLRLESGHRRYGVDTIERLCLVREAIGVGVRPSRALALPPRELRDLIATPTSEVPSEQESLGDTRERRLAGAIHACLLAAENLSEDALIACMEEVWSYTTPLEFTDRFMVPVMRSVGAAWSRGDLGVIHEHCLAACFETFLGLQARLLSAPNTVSRVVCTSLPLDNHSLAIHASSVILRAHQVPTLYLGANTPVDEIVAAAIQTEATAVVIAVSLAHPADAEVRELSAIRRALPSHVAICYGGQRASRSIDGVTFMPTFNALACWAARYAVPA